MVADGNAKVVDAIDKRSRGDEAWRERLGRVVVVSRKLFGGGGYR